MKDLEWGTDDPCTEWVGTDPSILDKFFLLVLPLVVGHICLIMYVVAVLYKGGF